MGKRSSPLDTIISSSVVMENQLVAEYVDQQVKRILWSLEFRIKRGLPLNKTVRNNYVDRVVQKLNEQNLNVSIEDSVYSDNHVVLCFGVN